MKSVNKVSKLLSSMRVGYLNYSKYAFSEYNGFSLIILKNLYDEGLISGYNLLSVSKVMIRLKYIDKTPLISSFELISKPSLQVYLNFNNLDFFFYKYDYFFISTSLGIVSSKDLKLKLNSKIGGLVLFGLILSK